MAKFGPFRVPITISGVWLIIRAITSGLGNLNFADNFDSFETDVTIPSATELAIRNEFVSGIVPTRWIILDQSGAGQVTKGTTTWSGDYVYLYNNGGSSVTIKVLFLR